MFFIARICRRCFLALGERLAVLDKYAHVLDEYSDAELQLLVSVATAPAARPREELPRLLRGAEHGYDVDLDVDVELLRCNDLMYLLFYI